MSLLRSQQSISFCSSSEADDVVEVQTPTLFQLVLHLKGPLTHPLRLSCVKYSLFVDFFKWILSVLRGKNYGKMKTWLPDYTETTPGLQYKVVFLTYEWEAALYFAGPFD
ncbi:unnamed protein product, partial [Vitis vinifera]|uniref:Uncharacterized protein n=1 Tax=Vitis vinifera TaxID=29760 RepID=D7T7S8_VITVI